jgi:hypothetical protein
MCHNFFKYRDKAQSVSLFLLLSGIFAINRDSMLRTANATLQ